MRDPPQARLDAAQDDRFRALEARTDQVGVGDDCAVGTPVVQAAGREIVGPARFPEGGVVGDHGIDAAAGDAPEERGFAETLDVGPRPDVGLGEDADAAAGLFQQAPDGGRTDEGAVDVGVPRDENHVEAIPAAGGHLLARGGQEIGIPGPAGREGCPAAAAAGHDCEGGRSPGEKPASQISP
ncbi:MAG: hypothetical protein A4E73_01161 [Syntrophaceae bacterium PtaU1.Bin231]|nr:MAG: hypothetical protein A4E73_01161 [Syntrophaceae bacterium PtaU1.Bin231]